MIELRNAIDKKYVPEIKNPDKIINIIQKSLAFNKQQKDERLKKLIPTKMFQRLPMAFAQTKAGNTSEN